MARWTVEEPTRIDFDGVVALKANVVAGVVSVLPTDNGPSLRVTEISGHPLEVVHEAGMLSLNHKSSGLDGVLQWLQDTRGRVDLTITVPRDCPVRLNLVTASAVVSGMSGRVSVKTASGDVTLDGVTGAIDANTATGVIEAQRLTGSVSFNSVSGDLALARGAVERLKAHSVSGKITTDVDLRDGGSVRVSTVSGEVTMRLPESVSAKVSLNSVGGRVDSTFTGLGRQDRPVAKNLSGTLGGGGASLSVTSVSGAITLLSRPDPGVLDDEGESA
jgi:Putative adhesin